MNINTLTALIPASFEYTDAINGNVETIELELKRMSFSLAASKAFQEATEKNDVSGMAEILAGIIGKWNIDADGEPFPPQKETIEALPADFVMALASCVFERLNPNPQKAVVSDNGSEQAAT